MNPFDQILSGGYSNDSQGMDAAIHVVLTLGRQLYGVTTKLVCDAPSTTLSLDLPSTTLAQKIDREASLVRVTNGDIFAHCDSILIGSERMRLVSSQENTLQVERSQGEYHAVGAVVNANRIQLAVTDRGAISGDSIFVGSEEVQLVNSGSHVERSRGEYHAAGEIVNSKMATLIVENGELFPLANFPIVIGGERMHVVTRTGNTLFVQRSAGRLQERGSVVSIPDTKATASEEVLARVSHINPNLLAAISQRIHGR